MERIRVLHVYKSFNVYNGLIEILTILLRSMDLSKYELAVAVYQYDGNAFGREFERLGGRIISLDIPEGVTHEPAQYRALVDFFRRYRPHIVQTHVLKANLYGVLAARAAGVPVVIATEMTLRDTAPSFIRRMRDRLVQPFVLRALRRADRYVVTSYYIKNEWTQGGDGIQFEVIYPPFNVEKYERVGRRRRRSGGGNRICFVGRLSEEKGLPGLLDAMPEVYRRAPQTRLTLVGTGPLEERLHKTVSALGLDGCVQFAGYMSNVFEALAQNDIFVLPSRTEGCPIVILEAMAMGLPVVATAVGGNVELVRHGETGLLVPYGDPTALADALVKLVTDRDRAVKMGDKGRASAFTEFHPSRFTSRLTSLYDELLARKGGLARDASSGRRVLERS
ncbi:MAG: glycosyltransferase [Chitinivibrionales bacterium]|nr:glycosyltransferase [Chitinivibrionales bacterium]